MITGGEGLRRSEWRLLRKIWGYAEWMKMYGGGKEMNIYNPNSISRLVLKTTKTEITLVFMMVVQKYFHLFGFQ